MIITIVKHIIRLNKAGQRDGVMTSYYENGIPKLIETYANDILNGTWLMFNEEGRVESIGNYKNGLKDGYFYGYHYDGSKRYEMEWVMDTVKSAVEFDLHGNVVYRDTM